MVRESSQSDIFSINVFGESNISLRQSNKERIAWEFQQCLSNDVELKRTGGIIGAAISGYSVILWNFSHFYHNWSNWGRISMQNFLHLQKKRKLLYLNLWNKNGFWVILFLFFPIMWITHNIVVIKRAENKARNCS